MTQCIIMVFLETCNKLVPQQQYSMWHLKLRGQCLLRWRVAFWNVTPCSLVTMYRSFREICCLDHQGKWMMHKVPQKFDTYPPDYTVSRSRKHQLYLRHPQLASRLKLGRSIPLFLPLWLHGMLKGDLAYNFISFLRAVCSAHNTWYANRNEVYQSFFDKFCCSQLGRNEVSI